MAEDLRSQVEVFKDDARRIVYGWASIARKADGTLPHDSQGDVIDTVDALKAWENAFLDYFAASGTADDMHTDFGVAQFAGGMVFTPELTKSLGIPDGVLPTGALVAYRVPTTARGDELWSAIKTGDRRMLSIVASVERQEIPNDAA